MIVVQLLAIALVIGGAWWLSQEIFWPERRLCRTHPHDWLWEEDPKSSGRQCSRCGLRDY